MCLIKKFWNSFFRSCIVKKELIKYSSGGGDRLEILIEIYWIIMKYVWVNRC